MAVVTYIKDEDARKAFVAKTIPFDLVKLELHLAGEAHIFADDIRKEEEARRVKEELRELKRKLDLAKTAVQTNLTFRLKMLLQLKSEVLEEEMAGRIKLVLERTKEELKKAKDAEKIEDLKDFSRKEPDITMVVKVTEGDRVELKNLNETFRVGVVSARNVGEWRV